MEKRDYEIVNGKKCVMLNINKKNNSENKHAQKSVTVDNSSENSIDSDYDVSSTGTDQQDNIKDVLSKKNNNAGRKQRIRLNDSTNKVYDPSIVIFTEDDVKEKLKFYDRIPFNDVKDLPLGVRIAYIEVLDNGTYKYKLGGTVIKNYWPLYVTISGGWNKSWCVQLDNHIIFREKYGHMEREYEKKIKVLNDVIKKRTESNIKLYEKIENNKRIILELRKQNKLLMKHNRKLQKTGNKDAQEEQK